MRVSVHNGCEAGGDWVKVELRNLVQHPKHWLANLDCRGHRKVCRPGLAIDVAAHSNRGTHRAELIDHRKFADNTSVDDQLGPAWCMHAAAAVRACPR